MSGDLVAFHMWQRLSGRLSSGALAHMFVFTQTRARGQKVSLRRADHRLAVRKDNQGFLLEFEAI